MKDTKQKSLGKTVKGLYITWKTWYNTITFSKRSYDFLCDSIF